MSSQPILKVSGVETYYGNIRALAGVDVEVHKGEIVSLIGANGAGKSTLMMTICGSPQARAGQVIFDGEDITSEPVDQIIQRGISRTFQLTHLFPELSVLENARIAAQAREPRRWQFFGGGDVLERSREQALAAIERLRLSEHVNTPAGLLSHGDQRLLEVAMAISQRPKLLLLDEPTQGLSIEETANAVEILRDMLSGGGLTVVLVEHDMEVVFGLADKITVLHRGAVIADGTPDQVKADAAVQEAYLGGFE